MSQPETSKRQVTTAVTIGVVAGCLSLVVIIGILAAIAIPNFMRFGCRAKASEARASLAGMWTAEKVFFSEYKVYSTDLNSLEWWPDGTPMYVYGFDVRDTESPGVDGYDSSRFMTLDPRVVNDDNGMPRYSTRKMLDITGGPLPTTMAGACGPDPCTARSLPTPGFRIGAIGDIDSEAGQVRYDVWHIDESRNQVQLEDDCKS